jgi:hypothetical protein
MPPRSAGTRLGLTIVSNEKLPCDAAVTLPCPELTRPGGHGTFAANVRFTIAPTSPG